MRGEIDELTVNSEALTKSKLNIERASRTLEDNIGEMRTKIEENSKIKSELDQERARNEKDIADLKRKIEEVDGQNAQVSLRPLVNFQAMSFKFLDYELDYDHFFSF